MKVSVDKSSAITYVQDVFIVASTNTDIPTYYSKWLLEKLNSGFIDLPSYQDPDKLLRVSLRTEDVRGFVFYSKNYGPFLRLCEPFLQQEVFFFFTVGDSAVFRARVPPLDAIFRQVEELVRLFGRDRVVWKLPPLMFDADGALLYCENIHRVAQAMANRGVNRCMIELFSSGFHHAEIRSRLHDNDVSGYVEGATLSSLESLAALIDMLSSDFGIQTIGEDYEILKGMKVSDIENRIGVFNIGRMGMPCPTKCLYCDTNFTVNYFNDGTRRTDFTVDNNSYSVGLERYLRSIGLTVHNYLENVDAVSPYSIELRAVQDASMSLGNKPPLHTQETLRLVVNVIGDKEGKRRAYYC